MPDWQERITRETAPAVRVEHDIRYRLAEPLILGARTWADLGCGNGVAAADVVGGTYRARAVFVDVQQEAVDAAVSAVGAAEPVGLAADLTERDDLARVREAVLEGTGPRAITCFEVIEHLRTFVPLVEMLSELAEGGEATVLLSVPNDDFWALENPYHESMWGEGSFAELRSLLPGGTVVARQLALQGSAVVPEGRDGGQVDVSLRADAEGAVATHFLAAMGPQADLLGVHAAAAQTDLEEKRRWERQREADLAYFQAAAKRLQAQNDEFRAELQAHHKEFEDWRRYIHELEGKLGLPLSGT
ncbi:MAG TPA: methyltransferase domain-containing protein [Solirubrobacteraceae bacterium]|nr:methyltransferase domain-containing protein [Solirubrobacteraceae bacterium]